MTPTFIVMHCISVRCRMRFDDQITTRVDGDTTDRVETLADAHGLQKSTFIRRLLWTGLDVVEREGVDELADEEAETTQPAD